MSETDLAAAVGAPPARRGMFRFRSGSGGADPDQFWPKFWRVLGRVPFAEDLAAAWYCWVDPATPGHVKAILAAAIAYFLVPADMMPDLIAGIGFTDDATVIATAISLAGAHIRRRHRQAARRLLQGRRA